MAGTLPSVRFKVAWGDYRVGQIITPPGTLRSLLLERGYAELVTTATPAPVIADVCKSQETAAVADEADGRRRSGRLRR